MWSYMQTVLYDTEQFHYPINFSHAPFQFIPPLPPGRFSSDFYHHSSVYVSCIKPGLAIHFTYDTIDVSMPFSQIISPFPFPTESKKLFYTSMSLLLSRIQGYHCHLSKFHIYALVYCIGVFLSSLLHSV